MGKKSSSPPDVAGAANITGEEAKELASQETIANRPDQYNPWGSTTWDIQTVTDPATGEKVNKWIQTESLNDNLQSSLDSQQAIQAGKSNLAEGLMGRAWNDMATPMDFDQYGNPISMDFDPTEMRQQAEDAFYQKQMSRLDPQFDSARQDLELKLRNQGLREGDQAWNSAFDNLGKQQNDAYEQARLGASQQGMMESNQLWNQSVGQNQIANQLRNQQIQEDLFKRGYSLEEVNKLLEGQSVAGSTPSSNETINIGTG